MDKKERQASEVVDEVEKKVKVDDKRMEQVLERFKRVFGEMRDKESEEVDDEKQMEDQELMGVVENELKDAFINNIDTFLSMSLEEYKRYINNKYDYGEDLTHEWDISRRKPLPPHQRIANGFMVDGFEDRLELLGLNQFSLVDAYKRELNSIK